MKKQFKIIIFLTCALFTLVSCNVKSGDTLTQDTGKDSISNYLEQKPTEESTKINDKKIDKQDNKATVLPADIDDTDIEYDVYKKVDLSEFVNKNIKGLNEGLIEHVDGGIFFKTPCKVTVKANIKIDRGPGLLEKDINDNLAVITEIGPIYSKVYYADYESDFFGKFHEVERACEFFNGRAGKGKAWFGNIGVTLLSGVTNWRVKVVSNNDTEFVGEYFTKDGEQTIIRVTIKDVYYKVSKPTGTVTDWDLDKDFEVSNFYGKQAFTMRELEDGYTYIIKPKFTYTVNNSYDDRRTKYLNFYYTSDNKTPENATSILNERENDIDAKYSKIGIGMAKSEWKKKDANNFEDFVMSWDKNTHTVVVNGKNGDNIASIKIDYIKEYKYKNCVENETPGYKRYLLATKQANNEMNIYTDNREKAETADNVFLSFLERKIAEEDARMFRDANYGGNKTLEFGDHIVNYSFKGYTCKRIPNLEDVITRSITESLNGFFNEYYNFVENKNINLSHSSNVPLYRLHDSTEDQNNYIYYEFYDEAFNPKIYIEVYIDLNLLRYSYSGYWKYGQDTTDYTENTKNHGIVNRDLNRSIKDSTHAFVWNSLGYEPLVTDWWYKPIENIVDINNAKVGDYIHFGKYWTIFANDYFNRYKSTKKQDLEWKVLDVVDDKMLITTRHAIDCMYFNEKKGNCTWENSNIRSWLNTDFINYAFDTTDKSRIIEETDKVFLLSEEEARKYFSSDTERQCKASYFARTCFCWITINSGVCGNCYYWLRTPGYDFDDGNNRFMYVDPYGDIDTTGDDIRTERTFGVRPAMWIKIN